MTANTRSIEQIHKNKVTIQNRVTVCHKGEYIIWKEKKWIC